MSNRWSQFRLNARRLDVVRTALFLPLFVALAFFVFDGASLAVAIALLCLSVAASFLVRDFLIARISGFLRIVKFTPIVLTVALLFAGNWAKGTPEVMYTLVLLAGLYVGAFFWVLSDPEVRVRHTA